MYINHGLNEKMLKQPFFPYVVFRSTFILNFLLLPLDFDFKYLNNQRHNGFVKRLMEYKACTHSIIIIHIMSFLSGGVHD